MSGVASRIKVARDETLRGIRRWKTGNKFKAPQASVMHALAKLEIRRAGTEPASAQRGGGGVRARTRCKQNKGMPTQDLIHS